MKTKFNLNLDASTTIVKVLLVFDCVRAGKQAKELCDRIKKSLGPEFKLNLSLWSTTELRDSALAQAAIVEAGSANLMIVAVRGDRPLAAPVRSCLERCVRRLHADIGALVVQLHSILKMDEEFASAYCFLKNLTDQIGLSFFSEVVKSSIRDTDYSIDSIHRRAQMPTPVLEFPEHAY